MDDQFYFQGKTFDNQDEFWKYVVEWNNMIADSETITSLMNELKKQVIISIELSNIKITNEMMNQIIENAFLNMIKEMIDYSYTEKKEMNNEILDNTVSDND